MAAMQVLILAVMFAGASAGRASKTTVKVSPHDIRETNFAGFDLNEDGVISLAEFASMSAANTTLEGHAAMAEDEELHGSCSTNPRSYEDKNAQLKGFEDFRAGLGLKDAKAKDSCNHADGGLKCTPEEDPDLDKCTKQDVCLLMVELDQRHYRKNQGISAKSASVDLPPWSEEQMWYYSTYKLKESVRSGGTISNSASCSFGAQAHLFRKHWTTSSCARLMNYRGKDARLQEYRKIYMDKMSNEWCSDIWGQAINSGNACMVGERNGGAAAGNGPKYAMTVDACKNLVDTKLTEYETCGESCREPKWFGVGGVQIDSCVELEAACSNEEVSKDKCNLIDEEKKEGHLTDSICKAWLKDLERI